MNCTPEELRAALRKVYWTNADLRLVTGWTRHQVRRWKERVGLRGRRIYRNQLARLDGNLWATLKQSLREMGEAA